MIYEISINLKKFEKIDSKEKFYKKKKLFKVLFFVTLKAMNQRDHVTKFLQKFI